MHFQNRLKTLELIEIGENSNVIVADRKYSPDPKKIDNSANYPYIFDEIIITPNQENLYICSELYKIGEPFANPILKLYPSHYLEMTNPSNLSKSYKIQVDDIIYGISINSDDFVNYIATRDKRFRTDDSLRVGSTLEEIRNSTKNKSRYFPGWGYYIPLPFGWNAGFCEGQSCTSDSLTATSKIDWFFKADWVPTNNNID